MKGRHTIVRAPGDDGGYRFDLQMVDDKGQLYVVECKNFSGNLEVLRVQLNEWLKDVPDREIAIESLIANMRPARSDSWGNSWKGWGNAWGEGDQFALKVEIAADPISPPRGLLIDLCMPHDRADDVMWNLLRNYEYWVAKHGHKKAKWIFTTQSLGAILTFWTDWLTKRVKLFKARSDRPDANYNSHVPTIAAPASSPGFLRTDCGDRAPLNPRWP